MSAITDPSAASQAPIPNYRQQVRKALPDHFFRPHLFTLGWYGVHALLIGASYWLLASQFSWWLAPLLALVVGHSFGCMGFIAHDVCHGASVRNPRWRDFWAAVGFSPLWIGPLVWRKWHNAEHHNNTQIEGEDPDHLFTMEHYQKNPVLKLLYRLSPLARNLVIFSSFAYRMTQQHLRMWLAYMIDRTTPSREKLIMAAQLAIPVAFWVALTASLGSQVLIWGYIVPVLVANAIVISYIATNHFLNPLADERDVLATSLSVTLPRGLRWLDPWHQYFGAHVAHHLFPQAPARYARAIDDKVAELFPDRFHRMSIFRALQLLWQTPWIYEDHTTLVDPNRQDRKPTLGHGLEP